MNGQLAQGTAHVQQNKPHAPLCVAVGMLTLCGLLSGPRGPSQAQAHKAGAHRQQTRLMQHHAQTGCRVITQDDVPSRYRTIVVDAQHHRNMRIASLESFTHSWLHHNEQLHRTPPTIYPNLTLSDVLHSPQHGLGLQPGLITQPPQTNRVKLCTIWPLSQGISISLVLDHMTGCPPTTQVLPENKVCTQ